MELFTQLISQQYSYIVILIFSILGMCCADARYQLIFFDKPKAAIITFGILLTFFLSWDIAGVALNIFHTNQRYVVGIGMNIRGNLDLPVEELLFLILLIYSTLILSQLLRRRSYGKDSHV
mgnify:CR=1 FL=1